MAERQSLLGRTPGGEPVWLCRLEGAGLRAEIITLGAAIHRLWVPDARGNPADVVLGQQDLAGYLEQPYCSAAVIGRFANRIAGASFELDGERFVLDTNERGNCLHGGRGCYAGRAFRLEEAGADTALLSLHDRGEGGFPGEAEVRVRYTLEEGEGGAGALRVHYELRPTRKTPVNLTNHVYFNLAGHDGGPVDAHRVRIHADRYTEADAHCIPTGRLLPVGGTPLDLREPRELGGALRALEDAGGGYGGFDHNYELREPGFGLAAEAWDPVSGRGLAVYTDLPGLQFYTGNNIPAHSAKDGAAYARHHGLCFETQFFPDSVHHAHFPACLVGEGELFESDTVFCFASRDPGVMEG